MKILVTGGAGYIGSHAVYGLIEKGYEVVIIDNMETGYQEAIHPQAQFYKGDIRDLAFMDDVFSKESLNGVIHFAANSLVGESMELPLKYFDNNVYGTQQLLKTMLKHQVKFLVFSSSAATYGEPQNIPITENDTRAPINPYGESKVMMEKVIEWTAKVNDLHYTSLRYFNVAGAHHSSQIGENHHPETHLIPLILQVPLGKREKISIFGNDYETKDGTCIRDYIHVEDIIDAHILAMEYMVQGGSSDIFNLGTGEGYSILEMINAARDVTGHPIPAENAKRRKGDPAILVASNQKAKQILGWDPKYTTVKDIIKSAWQFHQNFPNGY